MTELAASSGLAPSSGKIGFRSRLGFGASGIGTLYRNVSEDQAAETLAAAYDAGLRYFDTAPLYGHGLSELRVGRFLRTVPRETLTVSTKVGRYLVPPYGEAVDYGLWARPLPLKPVFDYSYAGTMRALEQSANRLGIADFDLVYIHDVDRFTHGDAYERRFNEAIEGCFRALDDLRKAGHVKAIGVGVNESDVATRFLKAATFDAVMMAGRYTLLDRQAEADLLPEAARQGTEIVVAGVFNSGILAAGPDAVGTTYDYGAPPAAVIARAQRIAAVCATHDVPLQAAAIQFPFRNPLVSAAVLGMSRPDRIGQNLAWYRQAIPEAFWAELETV
ncbi:aldo/keto reductase [Kaistia dalseonensis]|uniref:D-threo-aldose 1-dehydrogenase n=1 Tax=Kaistia dalseonensis TaxID=410840 RepID=A0ABU0H442_9HYPH|nr:aldo/keto reductase [Kaistia dalseonensis]MCX5494500.1 aldo/keto reductase [Kaistia dalseonensis]MDQ0437079.1 D-threo-aldose 1-dehydrogenase [Kaistia dalseonensis]